MYISHNIEEKGEKRFKVIIHVQKRNDVDLTL